MVDNLMAALQQQMIDHIVVHALEARELIGKGELDDRVLGVMRRIPRHQFVPVELAPFAYADQPLPIGFDKTISQPFIVALMTDLLGVSPEHTVLEIGTGLGYHTAVLAALAGRVYSVEVVEELGLQAKRKLQALGCENVVTRIGNGQRGWPEHAPFDRILVCAATELVPAALLSQLPAGGRMVVPTGMADSQMLTLVEKNESGRIRIQELMPVRFALLETDQ